MKYTQSDLMAMVDEFRLLPAETTWLEFKTNMADPVRIGRYISALSNMAAYSGRSYGYLVWGVDDETHEITGTSFNKVDDEAIAYLRKRGLVEGRKNNLTISAKVAAATNKRAEYIKTKSVDDDFLKQLVIKYLKQWKKASRKDIDNVLRGKLQEGLSESAKTSRITYLITSLRRARKIRNLGSRTCPEWVLCAIDEVQKENLRCKKNLDQ